VLLFANVYDLLKLGYVCQRWVEKAHLLYSSAFLWLLALWSGTEDNKPKENNNNSDGQHESTLKEAW